MSNQRGIARLAGRMLAINRETDYACRIVLHLATLPSGQRDTVQTIARQRIVPRAIVRRVATRLAAARLVITTRGKGGGLVLARPSSKISLLDVIEGMQGCVALNECVIHPRKCPLVQECAVHEACLRARALLVRELRRTTFDELALRALDLQRDHRVQVESGG